MKGSIYKIVGYGLTYYGSTIQPLYERKANHKSQYNNRTKGRNHCSSWYILEKGNDWNIELVEEIEFDDLDELRCKEAEYQKNNECVNKNKKKTDDELRAYKAEWAEKNRRAKGQRIKSEMTLTKDPEYYNNKAKQYRANETPEQKEERLRKRREKYKLNNLSDKQREYINRPDVKERRLKQQQEKRNTKST